MNKILQSDNAISFLLYNQMRPADPPLKNQHDIKFFSEIS